MKKIKSKSIQWIMDHVRPTWSVNNKVNWEQTEFDDLLKDVKKNSTIGLKLTFKF